MSISIKDASRILGLRFAQPQITETSTVPVRRARAAIIVALAAGVMICAPAQQAGPAPPSESSQDCPRLGAKVDLAFIIDRSGSLDVQAQGQTYNVEIEGIRRAILDTSLIPRDGSIAVAVFTFAGEPSLRIPFTEIRPENVAAFAAKVEALKCVSAETCPQRGSNPETNAGPALIAANQHLSDNQRAGARRVLLISTDGEFFDPEFAETASGRIRESTPEIACEVDVILHGRLSRIDDTTYSCPPTGSGDIEALKAKLKRIVFPAPDNDLPGASLDIRAGACNCPNAVFGPDCERQVRDFVELTRRVLLSQPATRFLTVNTDADTDPDTPATGVTLSLRQAIESANSSGATTITFDPRLKDKTIRPRVPLPALNAPDIRICGCEMNCDQLIDPEKQCSPFLTIDGIDTRESDSDGIVIRADRGVVRGLRIINFAAAGVASICNRGFSRIENNRFENNTKAGVRVLDPPPNPDGTVTHNIGNTISRNDILGSETPIDLVGDGPTQNDPDDVDEGPNTLLNFPANLSVVTTMIDATTAAASGVSFTGRLNGPTAAGATVEIFAIASFRPTSAGRVIDGVTFLAKATADANGGFTIIAPDDSPTCGYTASVTDVEGNTSELMFPCAGFARAKSENLDFGTAATPNGSPQTGSFLIENTGCSPLVVSFASLIRTGFSDKLGDDRAHFNIASMFVGPNGSAVEIQPGQSQRFTATFNPAIPVVVTRNGKLRAAQVLEATNISTLNLEHNGCAKSDEQVVLTGRVDGAVKLIDPNSPRNAPVVTLTRSRDELSVSFSVFDSDLDVNKVNYEFFKIRANRCTDEGVPVTIVDQDLARAISARKLIPGQSFTVVQRFSGARDNPEAGCVRVTVSDGKTTASATSLPSDSLASRLFESQDLRRSQGATIVKPPLKLPRQPKALRSPIHSAVSREPAVRAKQQGVSTQRSTKND